ncbi:RluA family pseudouridine synthase [Halobacteriovorax sp. JY17]|uniref:RluA family pseudouridine synthase n=1 Tax=Halobacteriovorax sp. JY17 TaxID=2014617 RepID=UPI000C521E76|nr:RluA family pseudouridine synthase [Halobacteriovorax sp. JY17]PIK13817.1 MAG: RNA pseudouridine synthase [Halobacteriovorax sp. JY17]
MPTPQDGETFTFTISEEDKENFKRLDQFLSEKLVDQSRSFIKMLYEKGHITSENSKKKIELKKFPEVGTVINVLVPPPAPADAQPENIPLDILFEDEHLIIVNKVAGMVVHPAPGNYTGTLVNAILFHCKDLKGVGDQRRPGIVHRLDKGTSGVMVVAKNQKCHEGLVELFSSHDIERKYECIAMGKSFPSGGKLESNIGRHPQNRLKMSIDSKVGKHALTHYRVLCQYDKIAHVELKLETGRTHQIRVHLSQLLHRPILCDSLYGNPKEHLQRVGPDLAKIIGKYEYPFLHAKELGFIHPITKEELNFQSPPPKIFQEILHHLNGN